MTDPFVSVVMPVRNEEEHIATSLGSVIEQNYPPDRFEVIVADGRSSDGTASVIDGLAERARTNGPLVMRIDNPGRIVPTGLNAAIARARGEVIVRVDGHCELERDYLRRCVEALERTGADNVGGVQRAVGRGYVGRAIAVATSSTFGVGNARFHYSEKEEWVDTVYLGAYRRDVFDRIGTFDETLSNNQDDEFNLRLTRAGGRILLDPSIRVRYVPRSSLRALWRQYFRYGLFKVRVMQRVGGFTSLRHYVPGAFVLAVVAGAIVGVITRSAPIGSFVPLLYVVAVLAASPRAGRNDVATIPVLPMVYATMHVAYGVGFLCGLAAWRRHRITGTAHVQRVP